MESIDGYLLDIACVRKYPPTELLERARKHTRECALEGHCIESGYAIVSDKGGITLLDSAATAYVVRALLESDLSTDIRCRVTRTSQPGESPQTTGVEIVS